VSEETGRSAVELIKSGTITFVVNTPQGSGPRADGFQIREAANVHKVSCVTTVAAALAAAHGMAERAANPRRVRSLQEWHEG
jgi:carbamoyl-phosphate synthase large subunit